MANAIRARAVLRSTFLIAPVIRAQRNPRQSKLHHSRTSPAVTAATMIVVLTVAGLSKIGSFSIEVFIRLTSFHITCDYNKSLAQRIPTVGSRRAGSSSLRSTFCNIVA